MLMHQCTVHGCVYETKRKWNVYTHLMRKHQFPPNFIDSLKKVEADSRDRRRRKNQQDFHFRCALCGMAFRNKKRYNEHYKRKHPHVYDGGTQCQVTCPAPGCSHVCQTREQLVHHAALEHKTAHRKYEIGQLVFANYEDFMAWKRNLEERTRSRFSVNSATPINDHARRVYLWCAKANKVRTSKTVPDSERKRYGNYAGRTKRVQSHCTAFITALHMSDGTLHVKFCSDHVGHNQLQTSDDDDDDVVTGGKRAKRAKREPEEEPEVLDSDDDDDGNSDIDVAGEDIVDHEEYVEDDGQGMYSDDDEDDEEGKKQRPIRFLTASDRMRPALNPSYAMDDEDYEEGEEIVVEEMEEHEEEEEDVQQQLRQLRQPSTSGNLSGLRFVPARLALQNPPQQQQRPRMGYQRPARGAHMRTSEMSEGPGYSMESLLGSRVMHAASTEKSRGRAGRYNHHLQSPLKDVPEPPHLARTRRTQIKSRVKMVRADQLYDLHPDDLNREAEEVVEEEIVYEEVPGTSYDDHTYYEQ